MYIFEAGRKYYTLVEIAEKKGISAVRLKQLCAQDRVVGAKKVGSIWLVPTPVKIIELENSKKSNRKLT
jgi:hypothetical protein